MEEKELRMVLDSHRRWLDGKIGGEEAQEVDAAKRRAEQKVVWLTDKLAYTCQCSRDTSCGIPGPCPLNTGVNCLDVEPADWANLAGKRWEE